jgi:hypothetical protein
VGLASRGECFLSSGKHQRLRSIDLGGIASEQACFLTQVHTYSTQAHPIAYDARLCGKQINKIVGRPGFKNRLGKPLTNGRFCIIITDLIRRAFLNSLFRNN